jgi:hypothetical protein
MLRRVEGRHGGLAEMRGGPYQRVMSTDGSRSARTTPGSPATLSRSPTR